MVPWYPPGREAEGERCRNMILRGEVFSDVEAIRLRKDGMPLTVSLSGARIHNDKGEAIGVLVMVDVIGRIGGDEFVVLIEEFEKAGQVAMVARKVLDTVARSVMVRGHECRVTASVAISAYPQDGKDSQTLLKDADTAMYRAKERGKNRYQFYSE